MLTLPSPNPRRVRYNQPLYGPTTAADATATSRPLIPTPFLIPPPAVPLPSRAIPLPNPVPQPVAQRQRYNQPPTAVPASTESTGYNRPLPVPDQFLSQQDFYQKNGITRQQLSGYKPLVSELLYKTVHPFDYGFSPLRNPEQQQLPEVKRRYAAWGAYLGLPTNPNDLPLSRYTPTHRNSKIDTETGSGSNQEYFAFSPEHESALFDKAKALPDSAWSRLSDGTQYIQANDRGGVAGKFTVYKGKDAQGHYFSYHDNWDLNPLGIPAEMVAGRPFEIYGRVYYNPQTGQPIDKAIRKAQGTGLTSYPVFERIMSKGDQQKL